MFRKLFAAARAIVPFKPNSRSRVDGLRREVRLAAECLEPRQMPAANLTASLVGGVLKIEGTDAADVINVRQGSSAAGETLWIDNLQIKVGSSAARSVSRSSVSKIEVNALGGNDFVSLYRSERDAVTAPATIWGGLGNDTLVGGNANDTLFGNAGQDRLYGSAGDDFLSGGTAGVAGATLAERDLFVGGLGWDRYSDAFDPSQWIHNGQSVTDIRQQESPTCQTLATLAAAVGEGISFGSPKITRTGNNTYSVRLYDNGRAVDESVTFNGVWSDNDPSPSVDSSGYVNPEFWTILMHRARLEHFYGVSWSTKMTDADWDRASSSHGGKLYDIGTAVEQLHGWQATYRRMDDWTPQSLSMATGGGELVIAASRSDTAAFVSSHAYAVTGVSRDSLGAWQVTLYNPWGRDGGAVLSGSDDGYLTVPWATFAGNFAGVVTARR